MTAVVPKVAQRDQSTGSPIHLIEFSGSMKLDFQCLWLLLKNPIDHKDIKTIEAQYREPQVRGRSP